MLWTMLLVSPSTFALPTPLISTPVLHLQHTWPLWYLTIMCILSMVSPHPCWGHPLWLCTISILSIIATIVICIVQRILQPSKVAVQGIPSSMSAIQYPTPQLWWSMVSQSSTLAIQSHVIRYWEFSAINIGHPVPQSSTLAIQDLNVSHPRVSYR